MSENNMNEMFTVEFADASVITVPIDTTLSNSGEAAEAAAVGAALALKADLSQVTGISVNGENPDAQGAILLDASEIPMTDVGEDVPSVADRIEELDAKTAEDIAMGEENEDTIAETIGAMQESISGVTGNLSTFLISKTSKATFESALYDQISAQPTNSIAIGEVYANYSSSPTAGGRSVMITLKDSSGALRAYALNTGMNGVYSGGTWTWS